MSSRISRPAVIAKGRLISSVAGLFAALAWMAPPEVWADSTDLFKLLETRSCRGCKLQDADLVHADLRDADLRQAQLQRANLGQARLDGAQLSGANLSFTSLMGASLRGADLRGARLDGTDLRQADLSGALLDAGALSRSHWQRATGIEPTQLSYAELHNAGAEAAQQGRYPEAEQFFSDAICREPAAAISWVARGISRSEQGKTELAANDFNYAASLYRERGEQIQALELNQAAQKVVAAVKPETSGGNGAGSQALSGALAAFKFLIPIAAKAFLPLGI
jgi:tetratricopeptide (TPR) repeat protein